MSKALMDIYFTEEMKAPGLLLIEYCWTVLRKLNKPKP